MNTFNATHGTTVEPELPLVIYGAGKTGVMLIQALERSDKFAPIGFVDRNP